MRRNLIHGFQPLIRRSGVIASVMQRNRRVQTPVSFVSALSGLALRWPVTAAHTSHAAGPSDARNARGLKTKRTVRSDIGSVVSPEVHAGVEARDLVGVAVEHERLAREELADSPLLRLTPARVIDGRIHIGVEAVLVRVVLLPRIQRLFLD